MRAVDQQTLFERFGDIRSAVHGQVQAEHEPFAAHFPDEIEFRGQFLQTRLQFRAPCAHVGEQAFLFHRIEKCQAGGARQRPSAKRGAVQAGRKRRGKFFLRQESAQRQAARQRFRDDDDVGQAGQALIGELTPRAAQAALNFVGDQNGAVLGGQFPRALPERVADGINSAFALNRLDENRADVRR